MNHPFALSSGAAPDRADPDSSVARTLPPISDASPYLIRGPALPAYWRPHESYDDAAWDRASDAELSVFESVIAGALDTTIVYIIAGRPDGAVKIGITQQPDRRLRTIQAGMAQVFRAPLWFHEFYSFRSLAGARDIEQRAHAALADCRLLVGEWFMCTLEDADRAVWGCVLQDAFPDDWERRL